MTITLARVHACFDSHVAAQHYLIRDFCWLMHSTMYGSHCVCRLWVHSIHTQLISSQTFSFGARQGSALALVLVMFTAANREVCMPHTELAQNAAQLSVNLEHVVCN